jgi:nucleotide-binding universal stress UspA family protein
MWINVERGRAAHGECVIKPRILPMPYVNPCTILSHATAQDTLATAIACAQRWQAHLDVVCTAAQVVLPDMGMPGLGSAVLQSTTDEATAALDQTKAIARGALEKAGIVWTCQGHLGPAGMVARDAAQACRFADVAILARQSDPDTDAQFDAVLFNTGVPILMIPPGTAPRFARIIIGWDDSPQALATVRAAMPLLQAADSVGIVMVDADNTNGLTPGEDLATMLSRHGIPADIALRPRVGRSIATALEQHLRETSSDLLVMGAYGHTRMREQLLGGVTRDILRNPALPLFLAR